MVTEKITLNAPERFTGEFELDRSKLDRAIRVATDKLKVRQKEHGDQIPYSSTEGYRYQKFGTLNDWTAGMYTGCYWLAYELTGDPFFKETATRQRQIFRKRFDDKIGVDDHDVGFLYTPTAVAEYKITGNEEARALALDAVNYFYEKSYSHEGKFIIRSWKTWNQGGGCRTMMDSLMNAPLLFWASEETDDPKFRDAAIDHVKTTNKYLIRSDASSYHHYQFDPATAGPVGGVTWQGNRDESCWSRGHSWGIYGLPIAYSYTGLDLIPDLYRDITYYMLNHLPGDLIPYWDYDFVDGDEPRDASAAVVAVCGMHEMNKLIPDAEWSPIFRNAAAKILDNVIDICTADIGIPYEGLIHHVTHAKPQGRGIDECAVYGDYFYLDALLRYTKPECKRYW